MIESAKQKLKQVQSTVLPYKAKGTKGNYFTDDEVAKLNRFGTLQECVVLVDAKYRGLEIKLKDNR